jgi:hypothetical protein
MLAELALTVAMATTGASALTGRTVSVWDEQSTAMILGVSGSALDARLSGHHDFVEATNELRGVRVLLEKLDYDVWKLDRAVLAEGRKSRLLAAAVVDYAVTWIGEDMGVLAESNAIVSDRALRAMAMTKTALVVSGTPRSDVERCFLEIRAAAVANNAAIIFGERPGYGRVWGSIALGMAHSQMPASLAPLAASMRGAEAGLIVSGDARHVIGTALITGGARLIWTATVGR